MWEVSFEIKHNVTNQGSWPTPSVEIDYRSHKKFRQGFMEASAAVRGREQVTHSLACLLTWGGSGVQT